LANHLEVLIVAAFYPQILKFVSNGYSVNLTSLALTKAVKIPQS